MSNFRTLQYTISDPPPVEAVGWDGTPFIVGAVVFAASVYPDIDTFAVARHDHPGGSEVSTVRTVDADATDGRITWPEGPQPPAWFTSAAEAMLEGVGR